MRKRGKGSYEGQDKDYPYHLTLVFRVRKRYCKKSRISCKQAGRNGRSGSFMVMPLRITSVEEF